MMPQHSKNDKSRSSRTQQSKALHADPSVDARLVNSQKQADKAKTQQHKSPLIQPCRLRRGSLADRGQSQHKRQNKDRDQEKENISPAGGMHHPAAKRRTHCRRYRCNHGGNAHHKAHFFHRRLFQHNIIHQRQGNSRPQPLDQPGQKQNGK